MKRSLLGAGALVVLSGLSAVRFTAADQLLRNQLTFSDASGVQQTITTADSFDFDNPFFQDLGTNRRTCLSCHQPDQAWTVTPPKIQERFLFTHGLDPIFRNNDGSNCEGADISTFGKRLGAFSLLLDKGLIRVGLDVPANAEFTIEYVDDPYDCGTPVSKASMYRRPLPSTNLGFLSTVMWDGRETVKGQAIADDLATQANDATTGHAQGAPLSLSQAREIVKFEIGLFTSQTISQQAGALTVAGAHGGPQALSQQPFCDGVNDPLNILPVMPGACATSSGGLNPVVFTLFDAWGGSARSTPGRSAIARGEALFNTRTFVIDNVAGLNGSTGDPIGGSFNGTCTVCHDAPNAGDHSISMPLNLGLTDESRRTPDLPLFHLRNKNTLETITTTDPGRAMVTGKWSDIGKFKGPVLRALAARAPYFHNGSAATLEEAVDFYDTRFHIGLTDQEKSDLVAFLKAL
jgi:cytochrome c peroxidase